MRTRANAGAGDVKDGTAGYKRQQRDGVAAAWRVTGDGVWERAACTSAPPDTSDKRRGKVKLRETT